MNTTKYAVCTTFNNDGYKHYGQRMIQTFLTNWPTAVKLYVYAEDCDIKESAPNLHILDLSAASPELVKFKQTWNSVPKANGDVSLDPVRSLRKDAGKGFKWDAVRFCHKVYTVFHAANHCGTDWLIWMDGDMVCHSPLDLTDLSKFCPDSRDLCYLGRNKKFSECGLYAMNLARPATKVFLKKFQAMYDHAEIGIFTLDEWHDSFVFDAVRNSSSLNELNWSENLITGEGHPLINSEWGRFLDHLKGNRKNYGHSLAKDLLVKRSEQYWQDVVTS